MLRWRNLTWKHLFILYCYCTLLRYGFSLISRLKMGPSHPSYERLVDF